MLMVHFMEVFGSRERYRIVLRSFSRSLKYDNMYLQPGPWLFSVLEESELCVQPPKTI